MNITTNNQNYYKLLGNNYYLEDDRETMPLYFSSNSVLVVNFPDSRYKVNLDELLIQYSYEGDGEFYTMKNKKLNNSGVIGEDIYFKKLTNLNTSVIYNITLTAQTIAKFGKNKTTSTSNISEFNFFYCANGFKMFNKSFCYKCFESCFNCSEPGNSTYHNCLECNSNKSYYYFTDNQNTKNCYSSCKNANKLRTNCVII